MIEPRQVLKKMGLTDTEIILYLSMTKGIITARDLISTTGMKRPTVYYGLGALEKRGLISKTGKLGEKRFAVEPVERLITIAEAGERESKKLKDEILSLVPMLQGESAGKRPTVSFHEGKKAIQGLIMETLYCKKKVIDVIAPNDNYFRQVGGDFLTDYVGERNDRGITTRSLWEAPIEKKLFEKYYDRSEVRILPSSMKNMFKTTLFLYDDKVLWISSAKHSYCLMVNSQEYHDTLQAMFNGLWQSSKAHQ